MSDDLVEWLRAQLDDDERVARAVEDHSDPWHGQWRAEGNQALRTRNGWVLAHNRGEPHAPGLLAHIARHDPARVLREVEAKRLILDMCVGWIAEPRVEDWEIDRADELRLQNDVGPALLRLLALPYADRSGYRSEWQPGAR